MPRPLKPLNPYASWPALFGATVQQLRLRLRARPAVTQDELGKRLGFDGSTVSAVERAVLRPDSAFVEACERELSSGGMLQAMAAFVHATWDEWDRSGRPPEDAPTPAEVLPSPTSDLVTPSQLEVVTADGMDESLELVRMLESSDLGPGTLESIQRRVDRYCRDYPTVLPSVLIPKVNRQLRYVRKLLSGRTTLGQRRELLVSAGWLMLLLACLQNDIGDRESAESSRDAAYHMGKEAGHEEVMAWSFELLAWFALVDGRLRDLIDYARTGIAIAPRSSAGVQLAVQEAKGWSLAGSKQEADSALRHAAKVLSELPVPEHPEHHFVFDAPKLSFYAASCYVWMGEPDQAEAHAREVVGAGLDDLSPSRWPMRFSETSVDLGLVAVQRDDLEEAAGYGTRALGVKRKSADALRRFTELDSALMERAPKLEVARDFHERLVDARREFALSDD